MPPLLPNEDKNFGGSLVLDLRKWWRHVKTIYILFSKLITRIPKGEEGVATQLLAYNS